LSFFFLSRRKPIFPARGISRRARVRSPRVRSSSAFACFSFYLAILLRSGFVLRQILPPICTAVPLRSSRSQLSLADLIFQLTSPSCRPSCLLVLPSRTGQVPGFFVPARGCPRFLLAAIFVLGQHAFSAKLLRSRRQKIFLCRSVSLLVRRFVQIWSPSGGFLFFISYTGILLVGSASSVLHSFPCRFCRPQFSSADSPAPD
jgi:hypothetical protein